MRVERNYKDRWLEVTLSRRNIESLLAKLDGHPPNSACAIEKDGVCVKAEPDDVHYAGREPGRMHEATERVLNEAPHCDGMNGACACGGF